MWKVLRTYEAAEILKIFEGGQLQPKNQTFFLTKIARELQRNCRCRDVSVFTNFTANKETISTFDKTTCICQTNSSVNHFRISQFIRM